VNLTAYSDDQYDALREISNIAMGRAADSLARLLHRFIRLPVPNVRIVEAALVADALRELVAGETSVTVVREAFSGRMRGEALVFFCGDSYAELADLLGHEADGVADHEELVLDLSNLLVGATIGGIAEQLGYELGYSAPSIIADRQTMDLVLEAKKVPWSHAVLLSLNFRVEGKAFLCHVLAFWPDDALRALRDAIDRFLEGI
jgi:chemotaxis protein CheC